MKQNCEKVWLDLIELAEGKPNQTALDHAASCTECTQKLAELKRVFAAGKVAQYAPPVDVVNRAKAIFVPVVRRMGLLRTSAQLAGARGPAEDFQAVYGLDEHEIRVLYAKVDAGWEVISQLPEESWTVWKGNREIQTEDAGNFYFAAKSLEDSGFRVSVNGLTIEVPSALEAIRESERPS